MDVISIVEVECLYNLLITLPIEISMLVQDCQNKWNNLNKQNSIFLNDK